MMEIIEYKICYDKNLYYNGHFLKIQLKKVNPRAVLESNTFSSNIINTIPLPSAIEFELFQSFGINVNEDNDNIIDTDL